MAAGPIAERNQGKFMITKYQFVCRIHLIVPFSETHRFVTDETIYVGGLDDKVTDTLMWELFVQAGPVGEY